MTWSWHWLRLSVCDSRGCSSSTTISSYRRRCRFMPESANPFNAPFSPLSNSSAALPTSASLNIQKIVLFSGSFYRFIVLDWRWWLLHKLYIFCGEFSSSFFLSLSSTLVCLSQAEHLASSHCSLAVRDWMCTHEPTAECATHSRDENVWEAEMSRAHEGWNEVDTSQLLDW